MHGLDRSFQNLTEVTADGFGPVLAGHRGGRSWAIRVLPGVNRRSIPDATVARLAAPGHPAVLPVEIGPAADGLYLAAAIAGQPLSVLLGQGTAATPGDTAKPLALPAWRVADVGALLARAAAALAASAGERTDALGPLTWNNVYLDPARPGLAWVFPLWAASARSDDWLRHRREDLLFLDRDRLRQAPGPRSDVFSIGAIVLALTAGMPALPDAHRDAAALIRHVVLAGHPLAEARMPDGPLGDVIRRALGGEGAAADGPALTDAGALARAFEEAREELEPTARALKMAREGRGMDAMKALHHAVKEDPALPLVLFKAAIEAAEKQAGRALRTLREALAAAPRSRPALRKLAELATDPAETVDALTRAVGVDPIDPQLRLDLAGALEAAGKPDEALASLELVRSMARADPSAALLGAAAAVRMGSIFLATQRYPQAIQMVDPYKEPPHDVDVRIEAARVAGCALHELNVFDKAAEALHAAVALEEEARPASLRPLLLNHLAHALIAAGQAGAAVSVVQRSLDLDPAQEKIWLLHEALKRRGAR